MKYIRFTYDEDNCYADEIVVINNICAIWEKDNAICVMTNGGMTYLKFFSFDARKRALQKIMDAMEKA